MDYEPPATRERKNKRKSPYSAKHIRLNAALKEKKGFQVVQTQYFPPFHNGTPTSR